MVTRKEKREKEKEVNYLFELLKTQNHFFKNLNKLLKTIDDPRHQSYITYDTEVLLMMVILKNACNLKSMREMTNEINKEECIKNVGKWWGMKIWKNCPIMTQSMTFCHD
ncbi:hypothetical protein NSQ14_03395 [Caldifermentibacillus hisashii]|uniref:hypothetical protein n=1 Tax=Caldifermentibacillus hisashii TaxID=996558 RepID=UPI0031FBF5EC